LFALGVLCAIYMKRAPRHGITMQQASTAGDGALAYQMMDGRCEWRLSPRLEAAGTRFALQHSVQ